MSGTYSFMDVSATLTGPGVQINMGYGAAIAEEGITTAMSGDKNTMLIGADGEGMHSLHADKSGTVTVRVLKTSPLNYKLGLAYDAQTLNAALHGKNVIVIRQTASGEITSCRGVAFKRRPDITFAKDGDVLEWLFDAIKIDTVFGNFGQGDEA